MKLIVKPHKVDIVKDEAVNEKEINISKCVFEFDERITDEFVKEAYFTLEDKTYKKIIANNECDFPGEILEKKGQIEIGVVAYYIDSVGNETRFNPSPAYFNTFIGSLKDAENSQPITPSELEQYEQALQDGLSEVKSKLSEVDNLDVDVEKTGSTATITITKKDGTTKSANVYDGEEGKQGIQGNDGISPTVKMKWVTTPVAGVELTITDKEGDHTEVIPMGPPGPEGAQGKQGEKGETGDSGVRISETEPTDPAVNVWIDPTDTIDIIDRAESEAF